MASQTKAAGNSESDEIRKSDWLNSSRLRNAQGDQQKAEPAERDQKRVGQHHAN